MNKREHEALCPETLLIIFHVSFPRALSDYTNGTLRRTIIGIMRNIFQLHQKWKRLIIYHLLRYWNIFDTSNLSWQPFIYCLLWASTTLGSLNTVFNLIPIKPWIAVVLSPLKKWCFWENILVTSPNSHS